MDHYETLGLSENATKEEIKDSFRRSALNFHPDRHSQSPEIVRRRAIARFKQASEAYEVLVDDRRRSEYDSGRRNAGKFAGASPARASGGGGGYRGRAPRGGGLGLEYLFKFMTTRGFLMSLAFGSFLIGGAIVAERSVDELWQLNNAGKSFEDAMESLEKIRAQKEKNGGLK